MYKFTNGITFFDEKTKDAFVKAGYKLVNNKVDKKVDNKIEKQLVEDKVKKLKKETCKIGVSFNEIQKELNENSSNSGTIEEKPRRSKKVSK